MSNESFLIASKIRELKGAPLACLILMSLAKKPIGAEYLERYSGYSRKPVYSALIYLEENGYVTRNSRYAWQVSLSSRQLPFIESIHDLFAPADQYRILPERNIDPENIHLPAIDSTSKSIDPEFSLLRDGIIPPQLPSSSSSRLINTRDKKNLGREPLPQLEQNTDEKARIKASMEACKEAGIGEPKRSILCKETHVTPDLIRYHVQTAPNIRMAIYRIEHGWRIGPGKRSRGNMQ